MYVTLRGSSPGATTAGILLLTRARQLGLPLAVSILGEREDITPVLGPAVCYAPVLASCNVGRDFGYGATVVIPGPPGTPIQVTVRPHGEDGWFLVDRTGRGAHPATQAFVRLSEDPRPEARQLTKQIRRAMEGLGMSPDPAILDVLFGAQVPTLTRLAVALRAGRALSGSRGEPINRYLLGRPTSSDPFPLEANDVQRQALLQQGALQWVLDGLSLAVRGDIEATLGLGHALGGEDVATLLYALGEIASHLVQLPSHSILPPLGAAEDSVAVGLKSALKAVDDGDANLELTQTYRFLGGRHVTDTSHWYDVTNEVPPDDNIGRLEWFCREVRNGRKQADRLWPVIVDPPQ